MTIIIIIAKLNADISLRTFEITVGVVGSVALILFVALIFVTACCCYCWHHQPLQGQQRLLHHDDEN